eukprot:358084-Chlamydomonas_euryale.AAC.2
MAEHTQKLRVLSLRNLAHVQDEYTPLILAAERGHIDMARLLLISGAQRDAVDKGGRTAIDVAMLSSHPDIAEMIALYNPSTFIGKRHACMDATSHHRG